MNHFYLGQKVVCIDDKPQIQIGKMHGLTKGNVYTIRWIGMYNDFFNKEEILCIRVEEINRSEPTLQQFDVPYMASRFRPLLEKKTDISIFHKLLVPKEKVRELENV